MEIDSYWRTRTIAKAQARMRADHRYSLAAPLLRRPGAGRPPSETCRSAANTAATRPRSSA